MANVVRFPTGQTPQYILSVNTPDFLSDPDAIINPDISSVAAVPTKYWKRSGSNVVEMTAPEKASVDAAEAAAEQAAIDTQYQLGEKTPPGLIVMWSGSIVSIPAGWVLCNGQNGTPDLRDRFIVGAGSTYSVTATGGEATHVLTVAEMPSHTHVQNAHSHTYASQTATTGSVSSYEHGAIDTSSTAAENTISTNATTAVNQTTGGGAAHNNLPPYYALAFIQKL